MKVSVIERLYELFDFDGVELLSVKDNRDETITLTYLNGEAETIETLPISDLNCKNTFNNSIACKFYEQHTLCKESKNDDEFFHSLKKSIENQ